LDDVLEQALLSRESTSRSRCGDAGVLARCCGAVVSPQFPVGYALAPRLTASDNTGLLYSSAASPIVTRNNSRYAAGKDGFT